MANEVKTIFTGDPSQLFRTVETVEARLKSLQNKSFTPTRTAAEAFSQPSFAASRSIQSVTTIDNSVEKAINGRVKLFTDQLERSSRARSPRVASAFVATPSVADNPSNALASNLAQSATGLPVSAGQAGSLLNVLKAVPIASAAAVTSVAALGTAFALYSVKAKSIAEQQLMAEERLTAEHNKQILSVKNYVIEYERRIQKAREMEQAEKKLAENIAAGDAEAIKRTRQNADEKARANMAEIARLDGIVRANERILEADKKRTGSGFSAQGDTLNALTGSRFGIGESQVELDRRIRSQEAFLERTRENLAKLKADLDQNTNDVLGADKALGQLQENARAAFEQRNELWKKNQEDAIRFEAEQRRKAEESIAAGKERIKDLAKTWKDTFTQLSAQANQDNPFVRVFIDSQSSLDELREKLKGLPKDMQAAAIASQRAFNANNLFGARADTALGALDLRDLAAKFRDDSAQRRQLGQAGILLSVNDINRTGGLAGRNAEAILENLNRRQNLVNQIQGDTPEQRLDRQLNELNRLNPQNTGERAIIDQRILRLAGSLDPSTLRADQRENIAMVAERTAEREERRFQEALQVQREQLETQKAIAGYQKTLLEINTRGGIKAVENTLTIKDETNGAVDVVRTPTAADTERIYDFTGFGIAGGTNR